MPKEMVAPTKTTHTPGPWSIHPPVRGYAHSVMAQHTTGSRIACADIPEGLDADGNDSLGNAQLIAAAPDMKRALTACYHALESYVHGNGSLVLAKECADAAMAALLKAEGRTA